MSEHQAIFGEQRATKISELVFVPIDSPKILLSDCCIQSIKSCTSCLIEASAALRALPAIALAQARQAGLREINDYVICEICVICGLNLRPKRSFRKALRNSAVNYKRDSYCSCS